MMPVGPAATVQPATIAAAAKGSTRPVAIARSTEHHVSSAPSAMTGSGRRPLLKANQYTRKTPPAAHSANRDRAARPRRGTTSRLMMSQVAIPQISAGSRTQGLAVEKCASHAKAW